MDLSALARAIVAELADDEPGRQVTLTIMPKMVLDGDAQLLDLALRNLLGNAWKFTSRADGATGRGATVWFTLGSRGEAE